MPTGNRSCIPIELEYMSIPIIIPMDQAFQPMESSIFSLAE